MLLILSRKTFLEMIYQLFFSIGDGQLHGLRPLGSSHEGSFEEREELGPHPVGYQSRDHGGFENKRDKRDGRHPLHPVA